MYKRLVNILFGPREWFSCRRYSELLIMHFSKVYKVKISDEEIISEILKTTRILREKIGLSENLLLKPQSQGLVYDSRKRILLFLNFSEVEPTNNCLYALLRS